MIAFGVIATGICALAWLVEQRYQVKIGLEIAPFEIAGAAVGLLLVLRTNAGFAEVVGVLENAQVADNSPMSSLSHFRQVLDVQKGQNGRKSPLERAM